MQVREAAGAEAAGRGRRRRRRRRECYAARACRVEVRGGGGTARAASRPAPYSSATRAHTPAVRSLAAIATVKRVVQHLLPP